MASEDMLTGLANRRSFDEHFPWTVSNCQRTGETVSLAIIDLDHFKKVNDTHGDQVGDAVLEACSKAIMRGIRKNDLAARWGGEELIVLLHGTDVDGSIEIAERVRTLIEEVNIIDGGITASIGIATFSGGDIDAHAMFVDEQISAADRALYVAKDSGRNRIVHVSSVDLDEFRTCSTDGWRLRRAAHRWALIRAHSRTLRGLTRPCWAAK